MIWCGGPIDYPRDHVHQLHQLQVRLYPDEYFILLILQFIFYVYFLYEFLLILIRPAGKFAQVYQSDLHLFHQRLKLFATKPTFS